MSDTTPTYPFRYKEEDIRREIQPRFAVRYFTPPEFRNNVNQSGFAFFNSAQDARTFRDAAQAESDEPEDTGPKFEAYVIETGQVIR